MNEINEETIRQAIVEILGDQIEKITVSILPCMVFGSEILENGQPNATSATVWIALKNLPCHRIQINFFTGCELGGKVMLFRLMTTIQTLQIKDFEEWTGILPILKVEVENYLEELQQRAQELDLQIMKLQTLQTQISK